MAESQAQTETAPKDLPELTQRICTDTPSIAKFLAQKGLTHKDVQAFYNGGGGLDFYGPETLENANLNGYDLDYTDYALYTKDWIVHHTHHPDGWDTEFCAYVAFPRTGDLPSMLPIVFRDLTEKF